MAGVDTVRGIAYQHAQAVLTALDVLNDLDLGSMRVEGLDDVVDIEVFAADGSLCMAKQVKVRAEGYTWGKAELVVVLRRWAALPSFVDSSFEFVTDGRLGRTGQQVADALEAAAAGRMQDLAAILGEDPESVTCAALVNVHVRRDPSTVEALLSRAERQVCAMLPGPRTVADAREQAQHAIDRLFRALFVHAGRADSSERVLTRAELGRILGVPADLSATQQWPGKLRERYLEAARSLELGNVVPALISSRVPSLPLIRRIDAEASSEPLPVSALLGGSPSILAGRTGIGKSTAGELLRHDAARDGHVVLLARAEAYLPGRLEALAADAMSEVLREELPSAAGRQALADKDVTLVIDGVSEVPAEMRQGLRTELLASLAAHRGARVVLLGRDVAVLRATLPSSVTATTYHLVEFDQERRLDLACRVLWDSPADDPGNAQRLPGLRSHLAHVDTVLGDAASNPLLLTMALELIQQGVAFTDRPGLYRLFIEQLTARSGASNIIEASATLGIAYAALLDLGRRYADPIEWARLLHEAIATLGAAGVQVDVDSVETAVRRCGLITTLGWTQTRVPIHDSFADYLAGAAHANRLAAFPDRLQPSDEQRVMFAAEIGGVDAAMAAQVVRDLPFLAANLAEHERRDLTENSPTEVAQLLRPLDSDHGFGVALWRTSDDRVTALRRAGGTSGWVDEATARGLMPTTPAVIVENPGPLKVAVRMWRQSLVLRLKPPGTLPMRRPMSTGEACAILIEHADRTARTTRKLIAAVAPPGHASALASRVGPLGLRAIVDPQEQGFGGVWTWFCLIPEQRYRGSARSAKRWS